MRLSRDGPPADHDEQVAPCSSSPTSSRRRMSCRGAKNVGRRCGGDDNEVWKVSATVTTQIGVFGDEDARRRVAMCSSG